MNDKANVIPAELFQKAEAAEPKQESTLRVSKGFGRDTIHLFLASTSTKLFLLCIFLLIAGAIFIPYITPLNYDEQNILFANKPFFSKDPYNGFLHIFGTDQLGRDIFVRLWYGARISLIVAFAVALLDCIVGVVYGSISGYLGGRTDGFMMRLLEVISGIPYMIVVLLLMAVLPRGIGSLIIAYSLIGWTGMARLVRGQILTLKKQEYYTAAKIMGASPWRIIFVHFLPNMIGIIIVHVSLDIPSIIFTEAFLSMLGMGVAPPYPSIGIMANEGIAVFRTYPMQLAVPGVFICILMLSFNLLGDRLQDIMDPKIRRTMLNGRGSKNKRAKGMV